MTSYAIHSLDAKGTIALSHIIVCRDDLDALDEGVRQSRDHAVEIWDGERLVARVKLGNAPLEAADAGSL